MSRISSMAVAAAVAVAVLSGAGAGRVSASKELTGPELVRALQEGGLVIYLRHGATDQAWPDANPVDLDRCGTQRNLSDEGRRQAREIGAAFAALHVRVGRVLVSPYCRCVETAKLAFGVHEKSDTLVFLLGLPPLERAPATDRLRELLATPPAAGTNTILVSHNVNLKNAADVWPKEEGDAHVFRPLGRSRFEHVAEVPASRWAELVRATGVTP